MHNRRLLTPLALGLSLGLGLFLSPDAALAAGLATKTERLPAASRAALQKDIAAAKLSEPTVRQKVRDVSGVKPEVYRKRQNPLPEASRELRALGKPALMPMLEALAFEASQPELSEAEREALTIGMLSAVGDLRDARSAPVLAAIVTGDAASEGVLLAAATALGMRCGDQELPVLEEIAKVGHRAERAATAGLALCRTLGTTQALAQKLASTKDAATRLASITALGVAGSSWAWAALGKANEARGLSVRTAASDALLGAFVAKDEHRVEARRAFLKCEAPNQAVSIEKAMVGAEPALREQLTSLLATVNARSSRK